jgi:hypothetical protein
MLNAIFDHGYYQEIRLVDLQRQDDNPRAKPAGCS